jgi:aminoglycoside phosphotransferase (APT) family kinase protein
MSNPVLAADLSGVLSEHLGRPVQVADLRRLSGGTSHETWGFNAVTADDHLPAVLRRDFERSMLDTDVRTEHDLLTALHRAGVPVPRPWLCAVEGSPLGLPFMVMDRVPGTDLRKDLARPGHGRDLTALAEQTVALQARIHALDLATLPTLDPTSGPAHEVARWTKVLADAKADPDPLLVTALAWLARHLPAGGDTCLVHGDFKANNLLITPDGELTVIDWELAHPGDPLEDLAWTMLWRTRWDVVGGLHSQADYTTAYIELTGRHIDEEALRFWHILALVKLWAMFATGMAEKPVRPTLRMMGRATLWIADQLAQELLAAVRS